MNREDIIRMAREAGASSSGISLIIGIEDFFERFAALIAAAEREECAKLCEQPVDEIQITDDCREYKYLDNQECAAAIRARERA
jgi:hypothetical protein